MSKTARITSAKDMTGWTLGTVRVLDRAPSANGNARWHCLCDPERGGCGARFIREGFALRQQAKETKNPDGYRCKNCRSKPPGEVVKGLVEQFVREPST